MALAIANKVLTMSIYNNRVCLNIANHHRSFEIADIVQVCKLQIDVWHHRTPRF